jgi:membrane protease YdiL (CAAX protease family)
MAAQESHAHNHSIGQKIIAIFDVVLVFLATFTLIWMTALLPIRPIEWQFLAYTVMIAFPLFIMLITRRNLREYGLYFKHIRVQWSILLSVFPVVAIQGAAAGWLLPRFFPHAVIRWEGALLLSILSIVLLFWTGHILHVKPAIGMVAPCILFWLPLAQGSAFLPDRLVSFLWYLLFLGPGEEFLFRGYIQSRLNAAFGRPFQFWGVSWGWGLVIASILFGIMHILNPFNPFLGKFDLYIWWGVWTAFGGLIFGYVREKAMSILPPALLHGLPEAIASLFFGFIGVR